MQKPVPIVKWWLAQPGRRSFDRLVFKPRGPVLPIEYNLWRGYAIPARPGYGKQRRLLRHIWRIVCKRDKAKFKYLIRWLAWAVQNPDRSAETAVVLMSTAEGSGKSTVGEVMLAIFGKGRGRHGFLVGNQEELLGKFNDHLETVSFVLADEIMWAGDPKFADAIKGRITGTTITIEELDGPLPEPCNRVHVDQLILDGPIEHAHENGMRAVSRDGSGLLDLVEKVDHVPSRDRLGLAVSPPSPRPLEVDFVVSP